MTMDVKTTDITCARCGYISTATFFSQEQINNFNRPCPKCHATMQFRKPLKQFNPIGEDEDD